MCQCPTLIHPIFSIHYFHTPHTYKTLPSHTLHLQYPHISIIYEYKPTLKSITCTAITRCDEGLIDDGLTDAFEAAVALLDALTPLIAKLPEFFFSKGDVIFRSVKRLSCVREYGGGISMGRAWSHVVYPGLALLLAVAAIALVGRSAGESRELLGQGDPYLALEDGQSLDVAEKMEKRCDIYVESDILLPVLHCCIVRAF